MRKFDADSVRTVSTRIPIVSSNAPQSNWRPVAPLQRRTLSLQDFSLSPCVDAVEVIVFDQQPLSLPCLSEPYVDGQDPPVVPGVDAVDGRVSDDGPLGTV